MTKLSASWDTMFGLANEIWQEFGGVTVGTLNTFVLAISWLRPGNSVRLLQLGLLEWGARLQVCCFLFVIGTFVAWF